VTNLEHERKSTPKTSNLLTCTSRLFAFPFRLPHGLLATPRASNELLLLLLGVGVPSLSRALCMISFTDCIGSSTQQLSLAPLVSLSLRATNLSRKIFAPTPLHCWRVTQGDISFHRASLRTTTQQHHQSLRGYFRATHISYYGPVMYEPLLLSQTADITFYRCLFCFEARRSDVCALFPVLLCAAHWTERLWRYDDGALTPF
jgi:hypothetical protein